MVHAVLIPFPTNNSTEHIQSTAGGYTNKLVDTLTTITKQAPAKTAYLEEDACKPIILTQGWGKIPADRIVCADSPTITLVLNSLGDQDTLYIRGHCEAGSSVLQSSDHTVNVDIPGIVALLVNKLPLHFSGKLKVYACYSACDSGILFWKESSFAKKLSDTMINSGWNRCRYYGYTEVVSTYVVNGHKRLANNHAERASSARIQV